MVQVMGALDGKGRRIALVCSRFNDFITRPLLAGAQDCLLRHGVRDSDMTEVWVPGALELPLATKRLAKTGKFDAVIVLGAVIRGETAHFDVVVSGSADGIAKVATEFEVPVANGVLTTDTIEQAIERSGTKAGNKGFEAAMVALEMIDVLAQIEKLD